MSFRPKDANRIEELKMLLYLSDHDLVRITEDLIDVLIRNGVIRRHDFTDISREKLQTRRELRAELTELLEKLRVSARVGELEQTVNLPPSG